MSRWRSDIDLVTRIETDDGGLVDREHFEIVNKLDNEMTLKEVNALLRECARPARMRVISS